VLKLLEKDKAEAGMISTIKQLGYGGFALVNGKANSLS
jgi:hypothetical protein